MNKNRYEYSMKSLFYGYCGIVIIVLFCMLTSCSPKLTQKQIHINYELEKAYLEYSYVRDSLLIEYYRTPVIEEDGVKWYTRDTIITKLNK